MYKMTCQNTLSMKIFHGYLFVYTKITPKCSSSNNDHLFILMILWVDQVVLKLLLVLGTRYLKMDSPNGHWMLAAD